MKLLPYLLAVGYFFRSDTYITITQKGEDLSKEFLNGYRFGRVQNELTYTSLEALIFNQIIIKESIEQNITTLDTLRIMSKYAKDDGSVMSAI